MRGPVCIWLGLGLESGRSTLAVAGVFGAGKTRSLTFLLAWFAVTTNLKFGVAHKENPAGRAITKLLTSLNLQADHAQLFARPVGREEADVNMPSTPYDLPTHACANAIPKAKVVISTTGLVWEQKGQIHSPLRVHMESVDILVSEEAQQDMDLKSAFVPAVPRQPFFRVLLGDPKQSRGGVADNLREHRALSKAIGLRATIDGSCLTKCHLSSMTSPKVVRSSPLKPFAKLPTLLVIPC